MTTKQDIINAIIKTAKENGGKPLGIGRFEKETGINLYDCHKYWSTFGEAQREAGFIANTLQVPYKEEFILESLATLMRDIGRLPTKGNLIVRRNKDDGFPNEVSIHKRLGSQIEIAKKMYEYSKQKGYNDIVEICKAYIDKSPNPEQEQENSDQNQILGAVYLFKHGKYYKIGKTNDTVRRGNELKIQLPENLDLIHEIKTDDPSGIEAYWHRRFESKRMNGEWFDLNSTDIKSFKRWRKIV